MDEKSLPPYQAFHSTLKSANVLELNYQEWEKHGKHGQTPNTGEQNYAELQRIWLENEMSTFKDFLVYYNNLDVGPFVTDVAQFQVFYRDNYFNVFKIAIYL